MLIAGVLANIEERRGPEGQKPLLSQKWLSGRTGRVFALLEC